MRFFGGIHAYKKDDFESVQMETQRLIRKKKDIAV